MLSKGGVPEGTEYKFYDVYLTVDGNKVDCPSASVVIEFLKDLKDSQNTGGQTVLRIDEDANVWDMTDANIAEGSAMKSVQSVM